MSTGTRIAMVTGATSGLGFETAVLLAEQGHDRVVVTGRTEPKIADAVSRLEARTGKPVFEPLVLDLDDLDSVEQAVVEFLRRRHSVEVAILNAGIAPTNDIKKNGSGIELTVSSSLVGHHLLTAFD